MAKRMNKKELACLLKEKIGLEEQEGVLVFTILERYFFFNEKTKDKIVEEFVHELQIPKEKAEHIYEVAIQILFTQIKERLKHPFTT